MIKKYIYSFSKIIILLITFSILIFILSFIFWTDRPNLFLDDKTGPWSVGFGKVDSLGDVKNKVGHKFLDSNEVLGNISLEFLADPFFIRDSSGIYIFAEHVLSSQGDISCFFKPSNNVNKIKHLGVVLNEPFHLSYAQVFKYCNNYYMLPESQRGGGVFLYVTDSFPYNWKRSKVLIKKSNVKDPTILFKNKQIYIFGTIEDKLYVWVSSDFNQPFKIYEKPLLYGTESRPGGRIFEYDGKIIMPIQNNSNGYGTGLSLYELNFKNEIIELQRYEKYFFKPEPSILKFSHGMHHLDFQKYGNEYFAVFDGNSRINNKTNIEFKSFIKYYILNFKNIFRYF